MAKISELGLPVVRKEIVFINKDGEKETIYVYNPDQSTKEKLIKIMEECTDEDGGLLIDGRKMLSEIFPLLSNVEIDTEDIADILDRPSKELILVNSEINTIFNEVTMEMLLNKKLEYENMLILGEQLRGMNMVSYIKKRFDEITPLRDFDPLNTKSREERDAIEVEKARKSYDAVLKLFNEISQVDVKEDEIFGQGENI